MDRLVRDTTNAKVGGVCAGLGKALDIDPTILRAILVFLVLVFGTGIIAYLILWAIMPSK